MSKILYQGTELMSASGEASAIKYDNTDSGLTASDVQAAIDENVKKVETTNEKVTALEEKVDGLELTAEKITYDDTDTQLGAENVQGAISQLNTHLTESDSLLKDIVSPLMTVEVSEDGESATVLSIDDPTDDYAFARTPFLWNGELRCIPDRSGNTMSQFRVGTIIVKEDTCKVALSDLFKSTTTDHFFYNFANADLIEPESLKAYTGECPTALCGTARTNIFGAVVSISGALGILEGTATADFPWYISLSGLDYHGEMFPFADQSECDVGGWFYTPLYHSQTNRVVGQFGIPSISGDYECFKVVLFEKNFSADGSVEFRFSATYLATDWFYDRLLYKNN